MMRWLLKVLGLYIDSPEDEEAAAKSSELESEQKTKESKSELEQQCFNFIKSKISGFSGFKLSNCNNIYISITSMPGYPKDEARVIVWNSYGTMPVRWTNKQNGECENFIRSCLDLAKVGAIWVIFSKESTILLNMEKLKIMDQGETFEALKIKFDLSDPNSGPE